MDNTTSLLPTTVLAVDATIRAEADNSATYRGFADNDYSGRYAFLLGIAEAKLAEANREYLRLLERQAARTSAVQDDALSALREARKRRTRRDAR